MNIYRLCCFPLTQSPFMSQTLFISSPPPSTPIHPPPLSLSPVLFPSALPHYYTLTPDLHHLSPFLNCSLSPPSRCLSSCSGQISSHYDDGGDDSVHWCFLPSASLRPSSVVCSCSLSACALVKGTVAASCLFSQFSPLWTIA